MRSRIALFVGIILVMPLYLNAQARTLTNSDLEKYREKRVEAEKNLRENYAKMGFASPEERAKRNEQSQKELIILADKLREERLERERLDAERQENERLAAAVYQYLQSQQTPQNVSDDVYDDQGFFWSYGQRYRRPFRLNYPQQPGYFAGGQFWPTPVRRPQLAPIFIRPRR